MGHLVGYFVELKLPNPLRLWSLKVFAHHYKLNLQEAEKELREYPNIAELFARKLKTGARALANVEPLHPVDGEITQSGQVIEDQLIQVKSMTYNSKELLKNKEWSEEVRGGTYYTYYLCPTDYHRIHSPVSGTLTEVQYIPGELWPVNSWSTDKIENLFCKNERLILCYRTERGTVYAVCVGATNVGKISLSFDPNFKGTKILYKKTYNKPVQAGEDVAAFHLGSTVIVLYAKSFGLQEQFGRVKMGESLKKP